MTKEQTRKDVDEKILSFFEGRTLSPRALRKAMSNDTTRPTYFRHKKKLLQQRKIEELKLLGEDDRYHKFLQVVDPGSLAYQQDIELYLDQMVNPIKQIRQRGYEFFKKLCNTKRTAWYFSPRFSSRFQSKKDVKRFLNKKLGSEQYIAFQLIFLEAIEFMLEVEPKGSLWKENLINCSQELIEELVWNGKAMSTRVHAFQILRKFSNKPILELAFELLIKLDEETFTHFHNHVANILLNSKIAQDHKYLIRRKLDDLTAQGGILGARIEKILKQAKP